jgi:hypothetical protein
MGIQHVWEESNFVPGTNLRMGARKEALRSQ